MSKTIHGHTSYNKGKIYLSPTYISWLSMKQRCYNKNQNSYPRYGGRGITVCERWKNSFVNFLNDMGARPIGKSIDRIDGSDGYNKKNCRWASKEEQSFNRISSFVPVNGKIMHISEIANKYNISINTIRKRKSYGWCLEEIIGVKKRRMEPRDFDVPDTNRLFKIKWLRSKGCTLQSIGNYFGISRQRVGQIIKK